MKLLLSLPHYHTIYLIAKLSWINLMLLWLEIILFLLNLPLTPFYCFMNFKHPCYLLNTKTRPMLCRTPRILVSTSILTLLEISHPSLHNKVSKTTFTNFLLKKITNPTLYCISKKKTIPPRTMRIHIPYEVAKSPQ